MDTSAVLALLNKSDPSHATLKHLILKEKIDIFIPVGIMAEIAYLVETRLGTRVFDLLLEDIEKQNFLLDCGLDTIAKVRQLASKYQDMPLGYSDATVIRCAMKLGAKVVSLDRRHFEVVQRELGFELLP